MSSTTGLRYDGWVYFRKNLPDSLMVVRSYEGRDSSVVITIVSSHSVRWQEKRMSALRHRSDVPIQPCVPSEFCQ